MLSDALRQYRTVSAESSSTTRPGSPFVAALSPGQTRIGIDVRRTGWIRRLAGDYAFNFGRIGDLYAGDPARPEAWTEAITRATAYAHPRGEMAAILKRQQESRNAPPAAREAAAKLASANTLAIVTGQQATAFGGPLFTLLKAITAIHLARRVSREHQVEVVPVFWVHAEDHDFDEVAGCTVLDEAFQPASVTIARPEGAGELPVADLNLDATIEQTIDTLAASLAPTDFSNWTVSTLRDAYKPGASIPHAFALWLEGLLGPHGLIVFESSDPAAKPLVADMFVRELSHPGHTASLAAAAGAELAARGHQPQVEPQTDATALFHVNGARTAIKRHENGFAIGNDTVSASALIAEAQSAPSHFSPNVLLRSVVQDRLFPTIAYVPGPSELAYLGQLRGVYEFFDVPMPLLHPRATATLIDSATARFLHRYDLPIEALQPQDEAALNRLLESQLPQSIEHAMTDAHETVRRSMERLIEAMPALDPTLSGAAKSTLGRMEHELRALHSKVIHAAKRRDETLQRQFNRARAQVFPLGHPQERTLAIVYFMNRYGPAVVDRLLEDLPIDLGYHWILTI
jgi:bacillithiol synthase